MKKILLVLLCTLLCTLGWSQGGSDSSVANSSGKVLRRLKIKHADPQLIYLLLRGRTNFNTPPEISTIIKP